MCLSNKYYPHSFQHQVEFNPNTKRKVVLSLFDTAAASLCIGYKVKQLRLCLVWVSKKDNSTKPGNI